VYVNVAQSHRATSADAYMAARLEEHVRRFGCAHIAWERDWSGKINNCVCRQRCRSRLGRKRSGRSRHRNKGRRRCSRRSRMDGGTGRCVVRNVAGDGGHGDVERESRVVGSG
jgi:hypothetical protein